MTKEVGAEMILSSATHARLAEEDPADIELIKLPPAPIKGKSEPVEVYALS